jgi:hypothetical protein
VRRHRAVALVLMMLLAVALLGFMLAGAVASWDSRSLTALVVVIVVAAVGGIAFSWRRYFGNRT